MMNSLSRQALGYLNLSEDNDQQARNQLCCLILLFDKRYQSRIDQLDEVLLLHILNHLTDCYLDSIKDLGREKQLASAYLIKNLTLSDIKLGSSHALIFTRCAFFSRHLLGEFNDQEMATDYAFSDHLDDQNIEPCFNGSAPNNEELNDFIETECNEIPAPELSNIKIESREPIEKISRFSSLYGLWSDKHNPALKH